MQWQFAEMATMLLGPSAKSLLNESNVGLEKKEHLSCQEMAPLLVATDKSFRHALVPTSQQFFFFDYPDIFSRRIDSEEMQERPVFEAPQSLHSQLLPYLLHQVVVPLVQ